MHVRYLPDFIISYSNQIITAKPSRMMIAQGTTPRFDPVDPVVRAFRDPAGLNLAIFRVVSARYLDARMCVAA
jgi:hypothetical protein